MLKTTLFRLCYASTATEQCSSMEIGYILEASLKNNVALNITGALFYGNHYFLQFLEGEEANVESLYQKIAEDKRHTNVKVLEFKEVHTRYFEEWSMKYVSYPLIINKILQETGLKEFNPYLLNNNGVNALAEAFRNHYEPDIFPETLRKKTGFEISKLFGFLR